MDVMMVARMVLRMVVITAAWKAVKMVAMLVALTVVTMVSLTDTMTGD